MYLHYASCLYFLQPWIENFVAEKPKLYRVGLGMGYLELPQGTYAIVNYFPCK